MIIIRLSVLIILAGLAACSGIQSVPAPVEDRAEKKPVESFPAETAVTATETESREHAAISEPVENQNNGTLPAETEPVVLALLDEAETLAAHGKTQHAIASLERGIRIKPKNPWLWHQLSVLKLRTREWLDAISIAEKSNSLARSNDQLLKGNWLVIADANEALGNLAAAEKARQMAENFITE